MAMKTFVNLPVKNLTKTTEFFTKLGFSFDPQFTDENATRMIISDDTSVMLAVEPFFKGFITPQDIADTSTSREVIVGLSTESREQVDDLADKPSNMRDAATPMTERMAKGVPQPNGTVMIEPTMDVENVANAVICMARMPLDTNVLFMTVMANTMPFVGRG